MEKGQVSVAEAGRQGGVATLRKRGRGFFTAIGRKGGEVTRERHRARFSEWGKKGGRPRKKFLAGAGEFEKKEVGGEAGHSPPPPPPA